MSETLTPTREVQVESGSGKKPRVVARLADWQYLERSIHRIVCGWGRHFPAWEDKVAVHRHVWEQSECVRRLRERLVQFPGTAMNADAPVSVRLERLVNTVLLAPSAEDAVDGTYQILTNALVRSYLRYAESAHPVHDAPTLAALREIVAIKESHRLWRRERRRRVPHVTDAAYRQAIEAALADCLELESPVPVEGETAEPVGVRTDFRLPRYPARMKSMDRKHNIMPFLEQDFATSIEARRLFWMIGYMLEMNLAEDQLRWIWDSPDMPWEFHQDVSRHLWDESRHGDSGRSRLLDFGIPLEEIGFWHYDARPVEEDARVHGVAEPMSPADLYNTMFFIGMVAETGHFHVKHEAYADFKEGGDLDSAEMMLFDIIDETSHVQYAHRWLPYLAQRAGIEDEDIRERGLRERKKRQSEIDARIAARSADPKVPDDPDYSYYLSLVRRVRSQQPLSNADTCPPRSPKPM